MQHILDRKKVMKMKRIIILSIISSMIFAYSAEAKNKGKTYSLPVIKTKIEGLSAPFIEIDQEAIEFKLKAETATVQFKKVAEFPGNYTPRIEELVITSFGSKSEDVFIEMTTVNRLPSDVLKQLNSLIDQPVGSTIKVKLQLFSDYTTKELKKANIQGLGISSIKIIDRREFEEVIDFLMNYKNIVANKDNKKIKQIIAKDYKSEDGESYIDLANPEEFLMDFEVIHKLNRDKISEGNQIISKNVKDNFIDFLRISYDDFLKSFVLSHCEYPIDSDVGAEEGYGEGSEVFLYIAKVKGKYKIVGINFAG